MVASRHGSGVAREGGGLKSKGLGKEWPNRRPRKWRPIGDRGPRIWKPMNGGLGDGGLGDGGLGYDEDLFFAS